MKKIIYAFMANSISKFCLLLWRRNTSEMFSDWLILRPYLAKVVQAQNEEERNSYDYAY